MYKKYLHIILLIGVHLCCFSQNSQLLDSISTERINSLKQQLFLAKEDSSRIRLMTQIGFVYEVINADSSIKYTGAGPALARQLGYFLAEAALMTNLGSVLRQQGKLAESLDLLFNALKIAQTKNKTQEIAKIYRRLSDVYFDLENFPKALEYLKQALIIDEENQNKRSAAIDHMSLGTVYEKMNNLDAASFHTEKAFQQKEHIEDFIQYAYQAFGNIQLKKQNFENAESLFREGLLISEKNSDIKTASEICADISALFIKVNQRDSAIYYASKGFEYGQKVSSKQGVIRSASMLAEMYDSTQPIMALNYFKIASSAKDSLFGINNIQIIQNLIIREDAKQKELEDAKTAYQNELKLYGLLAGLAALLIIALILYRNNIHKQKVNMQLEQQKEALQNTLSDLKSTQSQLIQSEKMASLGELTAGIAHEIQNPLNFVNNFSEVSNELLSELSEEVEKGNYDEVKLIAKDVQQNLEKINHHGKRADAIVKGMLQHSRTSTGQKEPTDINALCDEYLRLAYHGLKARDNSFEASFRFEPDETLPKVNVVPQDIGRVLLNIFNNAFQAVSERKKVEGENFNPEVKVSTKQVFPPAGLPSEEKGMNEVRRGACISISDNGPGIPSSILDKIFQPFFTTKPTGQGTGLGLSLSYDIVKAHGGDLKVVTLPAEAAAQAGNEGEGSAFIIQLPTD